MSETPSDPQSELSTQAKAFAKRLGSRKAQVRQKAEQEVQELGAAGRDMLIAILRHEEQRRKSRRQQFYCNLVLYPIMIFVPSLMLYLKNGTLKGSSPLFWNMIGGLVSSVIGALVVTRTHTNTAHLLAKHFEDMSIIGPLAEALTYRSKSVRESATAALTRLLPTLQEADTDLLTTSQFSHLHRALMGNNPEIVLAILGAFEQVGGSQVMPNVQKLASGLGTAENDLHVRNAAQQTLLHLNRRIEVQRAPQILLRAASANSIGGEILLRPAVEVTDTPEYVLLRPINNTNNANQEGGA